MLTVMYVCIFILKLVKHPIYWCRTVFFIIIEIFRSLNLMETSMVTYRPKQRAALGSPLKPTESSIFRLSWIWHRL